MLRNFCNRFLKKIFFIEIFKYLLRKTVILISSVVYKGDLQEMKFNEKLKKARKERGYTQQQLSDAINISKSSVSRYENGLQMPELATVKRIAKTLNISYQYLLEDEYTNEYLIKEEFVKIPVVGVIKAGTPILAEENILGYEIISKGEIMNNREYFYLKIKGDSMINARIHENDLVLIVKQDYVEKNGDIMAVRVNGDEATLKRVFIQEKGILLQSENPAYEPLYYSQADVRNGYVGIIGKAIEVKTKL